MRHSHFRFLVSGIGAAIILAGVGSACSFDVSGQQSNNTSGNNNTVNPNCGDGQLQVGEACDDGNAAPNDGCSTQCLVEEGWLCSATVPSSCLATCGDGLVISGHEQCDDGNNSPNDGCSPGCVVEHGYTCTGQPSACSAVCGDSVVALGIEGCDDGNNTAGDGCDGICKVEPGWVCWDEPSTCAETCGNGALNTGEICDDGNNTDCDGCAADCSHEDNICGDGFRECGEPCDDGNHTDCDGCNANCTAVDDVCGDGHRECGEVCDDGDTDSCDGCSGNCMRVDNVCGDGIAECGEGCDDNNNSNCDTCGSDCVSPPNTCGDDSAECGEECDGPDLNGENCSSATGGARPDGTLSCTAACAFDTSGCTGTCVNHIDCPLGQQCGPGNQCISVGDTCDDSPTVLSVTDTFNHTLRNLSNSYNGGSSGLSCPDLNFQGSDGRDRVYRINLNAGDYFSVWVTATNWNPVLYLSTGCPINSCLLGRDHAASMGNHSPERLDYVVGTSQTLWLVVDGNDDDGDYTLNFTIGSATSHTSLANTGEVIFSEVHPDPAGGAAQELACEWFEIYNPSPTLARNLQGARFITAPGGSFNINHPLFIGPQKWMLMARFSDHTLNCNLDRVSWPYRTATFNLAKTGNCHLQLMTQSNTLIDDIDYQANWPFADGRSMFLCTNHLNDSDNDSDNNWDTTPILPANEYDDGVNTNYGSPAKPNVGECP